MNIETLISSIKQFIKGIPGYIKCVYEIPYSGRYFFASLLLIVLFTFMTFPYEQIIIKKINEGEGKIYSSASVSGLDIGIIGDTYFDKLEVNFLDTTVFSAEKGILDISANLYTLLVKNRLRSQFKINSISYSGRDIQLAGRLTGDIDVTVNNKTNIPEKGYINLQLMGATIEIGTIKIPTPIDSFDFKLGSVTIQSLNIESDIVNKVLNIKKFELKSDDIIMTLSGNITLETILKNSKPDLKIQINPSSKALDSQRDTINALYRNKTIEILFTGSLGKPEFKLQNPNSGNEKNEN